MNFDNFNASNEDRGQSSLAGDTSQGNSDLPLVLLQYIDRIDHLLENSSEEDFLKSASLEVETLVVAEGLLRDDQMLGCDDTYNRHQLYADPEGRFTILALVWKPSQFTCIHGHNAWGIVGVRQGCIRVECFDFDGEAKPPADLIKTATIDANVGDISAVGTAPSGIHRLGNASDDIAITIHTYGMDLSRHPASINVVYAD